MNPVRFLKNSASRGRRLIKRSLRLINLELVSTQEFQRYCAFTELCGNILSGQKGYYSLEYGIYVDSPEAPKTLWMTHNAGLFSCLTTLLWTIRELQIKGLEVDKINNSLSMQAFKDQPFTNTYMKLFDDLSAEDLSHSYTLPKFNHKNKLAVFNHHGDYQNILEQTLGKDWLKAYIKKYMQPSRSLRNRISFFTNKYQLRKRPSIFVCYRGTDKYQEVSPAPLETYLSRTNQLLKKKPKSQIIIQTDQKQVRDLFIRKYGSKCRYISELPVTDGTQVIHDTTLVEGQRQRFCENLIAMVIASSQCEALITHTGNVGFTLAMYSFIEGNEFIQIK